MSLEEDLAIVAERTGVPLDEILGQSREARVYRARVAVWRELKSMGYHVTAIAQATNRSHGSVSHATKRAHGRARIEYLEHAVADLQKKVSLLMRENGGLTERI